MDESMKPLRRKEDEFMREPWGRGTFCALCFGAAYDRISMGSNRKKKKKLEKGENVHRENRRKTAGRAEASHGGKTDPPRANPQNEERKQEGEHYVQGKCCSVFERNGNE